MNGNSEEAPQAARYTERDMVMAQREAFMRGWHHGLTQEPADPTELAWYRSEAVKRYPLPKVVRPRVVTDSEGTQWKVVDGGIVGFRPPSCTVQRIPDKELVTIWADLFANPTETVEDDV
jgi:hypothetical protein